MKRGSIGVASIVQKWRLIDWDGSGMYWGEKKKRQLNY